MSVPTSMLATVARGSTWLRAVVYAASVAAFVFPLASRTSMAVAAAGAFGGALIGGPVSNTRLRSWTIASLTATALTLFMALLSANTVQALLVASYGPSDALVVLRYGKLLSVTVVGATGLAALSMRHRIVSIVEAGFCAAAMASLVVGHRFGAINRPFELADPIIASGGDPALLMLAVGVIAAVLTVLALLRERGVLRSLLHLVVVALLLWTVLETTRWLGLPQPPAVAGLGLRPDAQQKEPTKGNAGGGQGRSSNDDLEFRDDNSPSRNQTPVAVVLLHDDYSPPRGMYYFRQGAFSQYNGRRLVGATRADADQDLIANFPTAPITVNGAPGGSGLRATLDTTVALLADHGRPFALESPMSVQPETNPDPTRFRRLYRVTSAVLSADEYALLGRDVFDQKWSNDLRDHYTRSPGDVRYKQTAEQVLQDIRQELRDEPAVKALAITEWLGREGTYSLKTKHADAEDPTADFLFGDKIGYCVHFAHAAAYLLRSVGVPTRVATGYVIDESARQGGSAMVLTSAHSHAWPEVYIDGVGWVVMDVAPARSLDPPPPPPDPDLQRLLGQLARGEQPTAHPSARDLQPLLAALARWAKLAALATLWLSLAMVVLMYLAKLWRRIAPRFARAEQLPRLFYRAQLDRLADARLHRQRGESREAFARRLQNTVPSFTPLTDQHVAAAFGSSRATDANDLRTFTQRMATELRSCTPWWKRWLGAATPWTWLNAR